MRCSRGARRVCTWLLARRLSDRTWCRRSTKPAGSVSQPTLPKRLWTINRGAVEDSRDDVFRYHPWRAPGTAPVVDPCGQAGGKFKQTPMGGASVYTDTVLAKMGDMGSVVLPPVKDELQPTWTAGTAVDVAWGMRYNHGGGKRGREREKKGVGGLGGGHPAPFLYANVSLLTGS